MSILSSSAPMLLTASSVTMLRSSLVACTITGIFSLQGRSRTLRPKSPKIGIIRNTFLILRTRNQRATMTSQRRFQILMPKSLRTGMMRRMVSGRPAIPNPEYKGPWKLKKIKNPNYKGKWKFTKGEYSQVEINKVRSEWAECVQERIYG